MYAPDRSSSSGGPADGARNARYAYLIARLRNRQMTMEEATELFTVMQGMLQTSESARAALTRSPPPPPPTARAAPPPRASPPTVASNDDLLLYGILAMGAGAGLFAALIKRMQEAPAPSDSTGRPRPGAGASSQKG